MKLSFCTLGCPSWDRSRIVEQAKAMGYDGVELRGAAGEHLGPEESAADYAGVKSMFDDAGLSVSCIMGYSNFAHNDTAAVDEGVALMKKYIAAAKQIGCPTLRVFGGHNAEITQAEAIDRVAARLKTLAPVAEAAGVTLAMETHDAWCVGANLAAVLDIVNSPAVGVCWDVSNAFFVEPMDKTFAAVKGRIVHVHFKDAEKLEDGKVKSRIPGTGQVNMKGALELLKSDGYDKWLSFEWEKKWEPDLTEPEEAFPAYLAHAKKLMSEVGV